MENSLITLEVMTVLDILIERVRLQNESRLMDVGISNGFIVHLSPAGEQVRMAKVYENANGSILLPGLVEPHIHLDKAYLLTRMKKEAESLTEAIQMTADIKRGFTIDDMRARSEAVIRQAIKNGVTFMRCHAEVDPILGLSSVEVALELKEKIRPYLDMQVVVFPQEGIFQVPGTAELMDEALRIGGDVVGGITYQDSDTRQHLKFVFELANKHNKPIDFHADFSDNPDQLAIVDIAEMTIASGMHGLVSAGHVTSLGSVPYGKACDVANLIYKAGINIMCLPATDLFINGREDLEKIRRGLTPVRMLLENGVNVAIGANNVRNPFTPFGKVDPLEVAWLLAVVSHMGSESDAKQLLRMLTKGAARALGIENYGIKIGAKADMVLFPVSNERDVLLDQPNSRVVWKRGIKVVDSDIETCISRI